MPAGMATLPKNLCVVRRRKRVLAPVRVIELVNSKQRFDPR